MRTAGAKEAVVQLLEIGEKARFTLSRKARVRWEGGFFMGHGVELGHGGNLWTNK